MEKKFRKVLFPFALGFVVALGGLTGESLIAKADSIHASTTPIVISASHKRVTIQNSTLESALRKLLGKGDSDYFYEDDFLKNINFAPVITEQETTAPTYQIDLSNTGVKNITELSKFALPDTLKGINLSGNGITNEDLSGIVTLLNANTSSTIIIGSGETQETITPACDFSTIIKKVNLNNNNIDLSKTSSTYLNNTKLLFFIQNFNEIHSSGFVKNGEIQPMYYIRSDSATGAQTIIGDEHYMSLGITFEYSVHEGKKVKLTYNTPTYLLDFSANNIGVSEQENGMASISVISLRNTETAYFSGYGFTKEITLFDVSIDSHFTVERLSLLDLKLDKNNQLTSDSPITIKGFGDSLKINYNSPNTNKITRSDYKNEVNITIIYDGKKRTVSQEFTVVDTIPPVIKLIGSAHVYCSRYHIYDDPGVIAYDPATLNGESGETITNVNRTHNIDYTKLGTYQITYTVQDTAGLTASVTRTIEIQEQVLDSVTLRTNTSEPKSGSDIVLVVQPDSNVPISKYDNITYEWYIDNVLYQTTKGDSTTGKSTTTINLNNVGSVEIKVRVKATQKGDGAEIDFYSKTLTLNLEPQLRNNSTLVLGASIAIVLLLLIVGIVALNNLRKRKNTSGKHKNFYKGKNKKDKKASNNGQPEIQVIKNFSGTTTDGNYGGSNGGNGEGGGNANFRPPENNDRSL